VAAMNADIAVRAEGVIKHYGGVRALDGVSLAVERGEVFGIIGPNGAGKSTLFDILSGFTIPTAGKVEILGHDISSLAPYRVARMGVARTFQRTAIFGEATVEKNLLYASHIAQQHGVLGRIVRSAAWKKDGEAFRTKADAVLALTNLSRVRFQAASTLAYGMQRRLAVAVALMKDPEVLFLDEPAAGMNDHETTDFIELIRRVSPGRTIMIVEHDMAVIRALCGRALAIADGHPVVIDAPDEVLKHPQVVASYLGTDDE
jgi:branched-chain amino acid transport system ATP-binding protein